MTLERGKRTWDEKKLIMLYLKLIFFWRFGNSGLYKCERGRTRNHQKCFQITHDPTSNIEIQTKLSKETEQNKRKKSECQC